MSKLKFFPVTTKAYSKLEDLNCEPILLHSRGGGTDSIANVIEDKLGIKLGKRSYVPGSANRIVALIAGQTDATIVDLSNKNKLVKQQGDKFNVLPMFEVDASDEALFANLDWIKANEKDVGIFVSSLISALTKMPTSASLALIQSRFANSASSLASTSNIGRTLNLSPCCLTSLFLFDRSTSVASVWPAISSTIRLADPAP